MTGRACARVTFRIQITFDCADPRRLAEFYAKALHYEHQGVPSGFATWVEYYKAYNVPEEERDDGAAILDPEGKRPRIWFHRMDTPKPLKNRLHLDLYVGNAPRATVGERKATVDPEVARLVALGATVQQAFEEDGYYFVTCLDPEGNEFDVA
ncbi:MAG TPA: VOC family protein [Candidatus Thermoplasmatota archaeon]|nr:VOC family protein [Candidatus Thermoplasmatota archaeon]